jgi:hypothetical protein
MRPREQLQLVYELAFFPPRLHRLWNELKAQTSIDRDQTTELLKKALLLHLALPEKGFQSQRALKRVANYQASSKAFGMESFIRNIGKTLDLDISPTVRKIPPGMIRDMKLPEFSRPRKHSINEDTMGSKEQTDRT